MSFSSFAHPSYWLSGWDEDGSDITVPIASFTGLTAEEADGATGDIRNVLFALLETIWDVWEAESESNLPTKLTVSKSTSGDSSNNTVRTFVLRFTTGATDEDVAAE